MSENEPVAQKALDRMTEAERVIFMSKLEEDLQSVRQAAIIGLGSEQEHARFSSAYLLGLYRFDKAAGRLAKLITMEDKKSAPHRPGRARWDRYPAVEALVRIGKPSIPVMIKNLEDSDDDHVRVLSARVIHSVEGPELAGIVLQIAVAKQTDPVKKGRLDSAITLIKEGGNKKPL